MRSGVTRLTDVVLAMFALSGIFLNIFKVYTSIPHYNLRDDQGERGKGKKARREISVFNLTEREREEER